MADYCNHRLSLDPKAAYDDRDIDFVRLLRSINGNRANNKVSLEDLPKILRGHTSNIR
jgi:hypothetical protein